MKVNPIARSVGEFRSRSGIILTGLLILSPAVLTAGSKCFPRQGHCVAVQVNGQTSTKLAKSTKKLLKGLEDLHFYVDDTLYELPEPVHGNLDIRADGVEASEEWFGKVLEVEASVIPLQQVELKTHRELSTESTVQIGGSEAVVEQNKLEENRLPSGRYLLVVRLRGTDNWDRQVLYFEVADP